MKKQRGNSFYFVCKVEQHRFVELVKMMKNLRFLLGFRKVCRIAGMHVFVISCAAIAPKISENLTRFQ